MIPGFEAVVEERIKKAQQEVADPIPLVWSINTAAVLSRRYHDF